MVDLAVKDTNTQLAAIPEHLRGQVGNKDGKENVERDDILIPRLALSQALSPQLNKKKEEYIEDLEVGQFFNSVTGEVYGEEVKVIPLHFFKQYIEFKPKGDGGGLGGIVKMYQMGEVPPLADLAFIDGKSPKVTEFKNRMSLILHPDGRVEPIVVSFKSTGMKAARRWNYLIAEKNLPAYAYVYDLEVIDVSKGGNDFKGVRVERGDFTPAALFEQAKFYFASLQDAGVKVDVSGLDPDENQDAEPTAF